MSTHSHESKHQHDHAEPLRGDGQTVMFAAIDGKPAGVVGVADPLSSVSVIGNALRLRRTEVR